ncbi:hypothetical protein AB4345_05380 [Vibrio breoganii]
MPSLTVKPKTQETISVASAQVYTTTLDVFSTVTVDAGDAIPVPTTPLEVSGELIIDADQSNVYVVYEPATP